MVKNITVLLCLSICLSAAAKEKTYGSLIVSEVVRVYDGDTFFALIKDIHPIVGERIGIRIRGIDTPEVRGGNCKELAYRTRDHVSNILHKANVIELVNISRGKYFRIVADVYVDGNNLAEDLIKKGLAYPYGGGSKKEWVCD